MELVILNPCTGCCSSSSVSYSCSPGLLFDSFGQSLDPMKKTSGSSLFISSLHLLKILRSWSDSFLFSLKIIIIDHLLRLKYTLMRFSHSPTKTHSLSMCSALLDLISSLIYFFVSDLLFIPCCRDCKIQDNLEGRCLFLTRRCFKMLLVISLRQRLQFFSFFCSMNTIVITSAWSTNFIFSVCSLEFLPLDPYSTELFLSLFHMQAKP